MQEKNSRSRVKSVVLSSLKYVLAAMMFGTLIFVVVATYVSAG